MPAMSVPQFLCNRFLPLHSCPILLPLGGRQKAEFATTTRSQLTFLSVMHEHHLTLEANCDCTLLRK